jgi:hypothetical protein
LPRKVVLKEAEDVLQMAIRGGSRMDTEKRQAFDYANFLSVSRSAE